MINNSLLANIFSCIGTFLLAYSTFSKSKKNMLWIQVGDCGFNALGNFFIGSYSAMTTNFICLIRNIINAKGKLNNFLLSIISVFILIIGILVNKIGYIGLLPPIASVQYTIWSSKVKSAQGLRYGLIINLILWFIHDLYVKLYPAIIIDILVSLITLYNIIFSKYAKD